MQDHFAGTSKMVDVVNGGHFYANKMAFNMRKVHYIRPAFHLIEKHDTFAYCRTLNWNPTWSTTP